MSQAQSLWLMIAMQMLLFGCLWLLASRTYEQYRRALLWMGGFNLMMSLALFLMCLRGGDGPRWLLNGMSDALVVTSFVAMWNGARHLLQPAPPLREAGVVLAVVVPGLIAMSAWPALQGHESGVQLCVLAWFVGRCGWYVFQTLRRREDRAVAWFVLAVAVISAGTVLLRGAGALLGMWTIRPEAGSSSSVPFAYFAIFGLSVVNGVMAYAMVRLLMSDLEYLTRHDALTRVLNRRGIAGVLASRWRDWQQRAQTFSLLQLDLDHFKSINDRHGHAAGDAVLVSVARTLVGSLRPGDAMGRTGGEEFVVVLAGGTGPEEAGRIAERLRQAVQSAPAAPGGMPVTVSIGIATVAAGDHDAEQALGRADAALYAAKAAGRNRVCGGEIGADGLSHGHPQPSDGASPATA